jgi:NADPH-dependent 2,4-dienoyl-CoA reductase/sulfur reductase-like enzyme
MKVIIVGGVAGGMSAATRLRRMPPTAEIIVFERGEHVSYANCGLPYHVGAVIPDRGTLLLQTPETLRTRFDIEVRVRTEALAVDPRAHGR